MWNRKMRCANCSSYRACLTSTELDKVERLGDDKELIHSIPIYLGCWPSSPGPRLGTVATPRHCSLRC